MLSKTIKLSVFVIVILISVAAIAVSTYYFLDSQVEEEGEVIIEYIKPEQAELWLEIDNESLTMNDESAIGLLVMKNVDNVTVYVDQNFANGNTVRFFLTLNDTEYLNYLTPGLVSQPPNPSILEPNQTLSYEFDLFKIKFRPPLESGISPLPDPIEWPIQGNHTVSARYNNDFNTEPIEIIIT